MIAAVLPKTGSYLPLLAALGLLGIVAGLLLRILAMRLERR
jgi:LPXTG-motif cell wall-anchored protein